jgi:hypothetical protein
MDHLFFVSFTGHAGNLCVHISQLHILFTLTLKNCWLSLFYRNYWIGGGISVAAATTVYTIERQQVFTDAAESLSSCCIRSSAELKGVCMMD